MSIIENRLSTTPVPNTFLVPDGRDRLYWTVDYERGPKAITDTSEGLLYQNWTLTYDTVTGDFVITPETEGSSVIVISVPDVTYCTFTFDQNARPCITYIANNQAYLYWYDAAAEQFVTDALDASVKTAAVTMDDKRQIHVDRNDILLLYTRNMGDGTYNFYYRQQRDRYTIERLLAENTAPNILKFGMHQGLRVQFMLTYREQL